MSSLRRMSLDNTSSKSSVISSKSAARRNSAGTTGASSLISTTSTNTLNGYHGEVSRRSNTGSLQNCNFNGNVDGDEGTEEALIKIPIIGFEVMEERARFTVFKLRVENEKLNETWLVFRRYTDFERLFSKIREEHPNLPIHLPPKRWIRDNFETAFLEDRMKGLQAFVDSIMIQHHLTDSPIVREFFCLDEPPLYPENAEESRAMYGSLEESIMHLKDVLNSKQNEIQILRAQLALANTQHENLLKLTQNCRRCANRSLSHVHSPFHVANADTSSPIASSTPNSQLTPHGRQNSNGRSASRNNSLASSFSKTTESLIANNYGESPSQKDSQPSPSYSSSSNSDLASTSETESPHSSPKTSKDPRSASSATLVENS